MVQSIKNHDGLELDVMNCKLPIRRHGLQSGSVDSVIVGTKKIGVIDIPADDK